MLKSVMSFTHQEVGLLKDLSRILLKRIAADVDADETSRLFNQARKATVNFDYFQRRMVGMYARLLSYAINRSKKTLVARTRRNTPKFASLLNLTLTYK